MSSCWKTPTTKANAQLLPGGRIRPIPQCGRIWAIIDINLRFIVSQEIALQDRGGGCDQGVWSRSL